nr:MAG TPA: hypothetical protein [Caudoviricetes sp.]
MALPSNLYTTLSCPFKKWCIFIKITLLKIF